jgi:hypothetical protein
LAGLFARFLYRLFLRLTGGLVMKLSVRQQRFLNAVRGLGLLLFAVLRVVFLLAGALAGLALAITEGIVIGVARGSSRRAYRYYRF